MEWAEWKPWYDRISADLELDQSRDMESALLLDSLIAERSGKLTDLSRMLQGREVTVVGPASIGGADFDDSVVISAGAATDVLVDMGITPCAMVTDLDGDVAAQARASRGGALAVIHAHGDNVEALRKWVPRFCPPVIATTQNMPVGNVHNFGGFTDGDRSVFIAEHFGASRIVLRGFDFGTPVYKYRTDPGMKMKKLDYARKLIERLAGTGRAEIIL